MRSCRHSSVARLVTRRRPNDSPKLTHWIGVARPTDRSRLGRPARHGNAPIVPCCRSKRATTRILVFASRIFRSPLARPPRRSVSACPWAPGAELPDFWKVTRRLATRLSTDRRSQWRSDRSASRKRRWPSCPATRRRHGQRTQYVVVRMSVTNYAAAPQDNGAAPVGRPHGR